MKRITVLLLGVMFAVVSYAQSNISHSREVYAFVMVVESTTKTWAKMDYGDGSPRMAFADEKGEKGNSKPSLNLLIYLSRTDGRLRNFLLCVPR